MHMGTSPSPTTLGAASNALLNLGSEQYVYLETTEGA